MKTFALALLLASPLLAAPALAQTPTATPTRTPVPVALSGNYPQGRANKLDRIRRGLNQEVCFRCGRNAGCSQAQARQHPACTTAEVYSDVSDFTIRYMAEDFLNRLNTLEAELDRADFIRKFGLATGTEQRTIWATLGLDEGTFPGPTPSPTFTPTPTPTP